MATVFMKWLETTPAGYDRGIRLLTLGRLASLREHIAREYIHEGSRVLEIGCGTGALAVMMAQQGAAVTGMDASPAMLAEAEKRISDEGMSDRVTLHHMDATLICERFEPGSFDLIVSTLVFSELSPEEQRYVLGACAPLLAPGGRLVIADEVIPSGPLARLVFYLVRLPLVLVTWLLTRTTTSALHDFEGTLAGAGFHARRAASYLGGSLVLYESAVEPSTATTELPPGVVGRLVSRATLRTLLIDLWGLFFRIIPPYPRVRPGLYVVGNPNSEAPVLVTGNFDITVRRVVRAIDGKVDAWLLLADSAGINVWCGAGGGYFTAEKIVAAIKSSHLEEIVSHHTLILPQLCANGVDGNRIHQETGWQVRWGPVYARDIPAYLEAGRKKTEAMRRVRFPLVNRLEMTSITLGFYGLLIFIPVAIFWRHLFWPIAVSLLALSYFYAIVHPWLPGRDGLVKSLPLTLVTLAGFGMYGLILNPLPPERLFNWGVGLTGLAVFTAAEMQGASPVMRGEQANWIWEALAAIALGLVYWLAPMALGWR